MNVKLLDCTLRDGGYINNWNFGRDKICRIIENLTNAGIECVECGFLKNEIWGNDYSLFNNPNDIADFIDVNNKKNTNFAFMINYGEFDIEKLEPCKYENIIIRIAFKKKDIKNIAEFASKIRAKGYRIILNPMSANNYDEEELFKFLEGVNRLKPFGYTIVDTTGSIKTYELTNLFEKIDNNLDRDIAIGFHSHNNLQLSFYNAQLIMSQKTDRLLIIDSTLMGMGRGAGNLSTEIITSYINHNLGCEKYNSNLIQNLVSECIKPIYDKTPWGYSIYYYLSALNNCHPNYAKFLTEKGTISIDKVNHILSMIPKDKKYEFDGDLISELYSNYFILQP